MSGGSRRGRKRRIRGQETDLAEAAGPDAFTTEIGFGAQGEMEDPALARVHGREEEGRVSLAHAFGGGGGAHAELLDANAAIVVGVEADQGVILGGHAKDFHGEMLEREQELGFVFEEHADVGTGEVDHEFGILEIGVAFGAGLRDVNIEVETRVVDRFFQKARDLSFRYVIRIFRFGHDESVTGLSSYTSSGT